MARKAQRRSTDQTILVVDDQEETLLSVKSLLERDGHRVLTAESGERALAIFKENEVHLLLVDYFMPRMTGEQLIREIRAFDPLVQIILQTGYSGEKPPRMMLGDLDIQGYHDKADGPEKLLVWVDVGLKAHRLIHRLQERERLQSELVANVSHEFRTPLNIISGYAELLIDNAFGDLPPGALEPLRSLARATENLSELVSDFLAYAKLEAGAMNVSRQWVSTSELVRELERLAGLLLEEKEVRFTVDLSDAPRATFTDSVKVRTVLRNLITNAAKFTAQGSVNLRVARDGEIVRFAVSDTGPGVRAEDLELIFEPFRQLDGSSTRSHQGIGLGLALSRKLARLLGGDIEACSEPGAGSVFALVVPLQAEQPDQAESTTLAPSIRAELSDA